MKLRTVALLIVFVALLLVAFGLYVQMLAGAIVPPEQRQYAPGYRLVIGETGVVDNGEEGTRSPYILYSLEAVDIYGANFTAKAYAKEIPTDIYLLDYPCEECRTLPEFKSSLEQELKGWGVIPSNSTLIELKFNQLEMIGKKSILIVPTGRIPSALFDSESQASLQRLMDRGSVVVYIGSDLSQWKTRSGVIEEVPAGALGQYLSYVTVQTGPASRPYTFEGGNYRLSTETMSHDVISVQNVSEGFFVAFPNSLDLGWSSRAGGNGTAAAKDVADFIASVGWQQPLSEGGRSISTPSLAVNGTDTIVVSPGMMNGGYLRLYTNFFVPNGTVIREYHDLYITNPVTGRLYNTNFTVNGSIIPVMMELRENFSEPREFEIYLGAYKDGQLVDRRVLGLVNFITVLKQEKRYQVNLTGGDYILRITDASNNIYAQSLLHIPVVAASIGGANWDDGAFTFMLLSDSQPVAGTDVAVSMDGGPPEASRTDGNGAFTYKPASKPGFGEHTFTITATGRSFSLTASRTKAETFFDKPMNQAIIVVTVLVLVVGLALRTSEPPKYFLDVPDFPPQHKERIPLSRFALVNLMENINKEYRWKYMPLSLQEIKAGVRKHISYQGKPVLISDYNLEKLLGQLEESGQASRALGLYGLSSWQKQSEKEMRYLAIFRTLRSFFIGHAVLFTDVGARKDCDILVNYRGESIYVHIYEGEATVRRALASARKGKNFIIFESRDALQDFLLELGPASTQLAVALKMEINARQLILTHIDALGQIIGRAA